MRIFIIVLGTIIYGVWYAEYLYLAQSKFFTLDKIWLKETMINGSTAFITTLLFCMAITCKSYTEKAWLKTSGLFVGMVFWWKPLYSLNLFHDLSVWYVLCLCIGTGIIILVFFYEAHKHNLHKDDE